MGQASLDAVVAAQAGDGDGHTAFFNTFMAGCVGASVSEFLVDPSGAEPPETCAD